VRQTIHLLPDLYVICMLRYPRDSAASRHNADPDWKKHLPLIAGQLLHGPITKDLITYGYEPNGEREKKLVGIIPDLSPGHWPEQLSSAKINTARLTSPLIAIWVPLGHYSFTGPLSRAIRLTVSLIKQVAGLGAWKKTFPGYN
jgi:hypothetical protein